MYNQFIGIGRLGKDIDLKYTPGGSAVASFSIACETSYKQKEEWKRETEWVNVVVWGKRAETMKEHLGKGSLVMVVGRLKTRSWETQGQKQYRTEVIASDIKFLERKAETNKQAEQEQQEIPEAESGLEPF